MGLITKQQYIIVGFDPGLADTGFGVIKVEGDKLTCLDYGSLRTPAKVDLTRRLSLLYHKAEDILNEYKPDLVGIEQLFFCRNVTTAFGVGQARGVDLVGQPGRRRRQAEAAEHEVALPLVLAPEGHLGCR